MMVSSIPTAPTINRVDSVALALSSADSGPQKAGVLVQSWSKPRPNKEKGRLAPSRPFSFRLIASYWILNSKQQFSQASDVGSIPIARSITHDDSIGLAHLNCRNLAEKWPFLDPKWTPVDSIGPGVSQKERAS